MAVLTIRRKKSEFDANLFLQGGIRFPLPYKGNELLYGLHGKTLIFTAPAVTVTFADASGSGLRIAEVMAQIIADSVDVLRCSLRDGILYVKQTTPTAGVVLGSAGTANAYFSIASGIVLTGTFYNPPDGAAPRLVSFADTGIMDGFTLLTEE